MYFLGAGGGNIVFGSYANHDGGTGSYNTIVGAVAGYSTPGSGNVFIGYAAGYSETGSNKLYTSNNIYDPTYELICGEFDNRILGFNASVGIGTKSPDKKLHVVDDARITGDIYYGTVCNLT